MDLASWAVSAVLEVAGFSSWVGMDCSPVRVMNESGGLVWVDAVWFASYRSRSTDYSLSTIRFYECSMCGWRRWVHVERVNFGGEFL